MKKMAEKYPNKKEMNEIFQEFCENQKIQGKTSKEKEYMIVINKILTSLENCQVHSEDLYKLLIEMENEKSKPTVD